MLLRAILAVAFLQCASAHFTLEFPPTRGFDEDLEPNFCGGFPNVANPRTDFPLNTTTMHITSHHTLATVDVLISLSSDPTSYSQFSDGTNIPFLKSFFQIAEGPACFDVDVSSLNLTGAHDGANATIQVQFNGGDGELFQCADVVLRANYSVPSNDTCALTTLLNPESASSIASVASMSSTAAVSAAQTGASASPASASASATKVSSATCSVAKIGGLGGFLALFALSISI